MIVFVDYEHADRYAAGDNVQLQAARTWLTYRLEDLAAMACLLVRWNRVTPELLARIGAKALFISGNSADPEAYTTDEIAPLNDIIVRAELPIFGFCGGLQCAAQALGVDLAPLCVDAELRADLDNSEVLTTWPNGSVAEVGYHPIELLGEHPLLDGLGDAPIFRHAHGLHVPEPPTQWNVLARTEVTPVQLVVDDDRRFVGTQFHPEYWTDEHPDGRTLIANFLRWAEVS